MKGRRDKGRDTKKGREGGGRKGETERPRPYPVAKVNKSINAVGMHTKG